MFNVINIVIGLLAGAIMGVVGMGGGAIIVPALIMSGINTEHAIGTTIGVQLLPVGILAAFQYYRKGLLIPLNVLQVGLGVFIGMTVTAYLATKGYVSQLIVHVLVGIVIMIVGAFILGRALMDYMS